MNHEPEVQSFTEEIFKQYSISGDKRVLKGICLCTLLTKTGDLLHWGIISMLIKHLFKKPCQGQTSLGRKDTNFMRTTNDNPTREINTNHRDVGYQYQGDLTKVSSLMKRSFPYSSKSVHYLEEKDCRKSY